MQKLKNDKILYQRLSANALAGRERFNQLNYISWQAKIYQEVYSSKNLHKK